MEGCLQADRNSGKTSGKAIDPMHEFVLRETDFNRFRRYVYDASGIDLHEGKKELLRARLTRIIVPFWEWEKTLAFRRRL